MSGIGLSIASIGVFLWLPGKLICSIGKNASNRTSVDAFFAGWLWLVIATMLLSPLVASSEKLSLLVRSSSCLLALFLLIVKVYEKSRGLVTRRQESVSIGYCADKVFILLFVFVFLFSYLITHNLGFDDVSNLQYLWRGLQENPFPVHRTLVGYWQAARYPAFGTVNIVIAQGITGGAFYVYYALGFLLFACFLVKIYEWFLFQNQRRLQALSVVMIASAILMFAGQVNFFNHGVYPFQQSKLLFIVGIIYFYKGLRAPAVSFNLILGTGLLVAAWLHHLNTVLLYALVFPILLLSILLVAASGKAKVKKIVLLVGFPLLLILPALLFSGKSFIRYKEPPPVVSTGVVKKTAPLTLWQRIEKKVLLVFQWVTQGRQKEAYFSRIISYEIPLIILLVFFSTRIRYNKKSLNLALISSLFALMLLHTLTILPRQALLSAYRSGPYLMFFDIWRSDVRPQGLCLTDPYTALYLRVLRGTNAVELNDLQHVLSFSPLVSKDDLRLFAADMDSLAGKQLVFNGRFGGRKAVSFLMGEERGDYLQLYKNIEKWLEENNYQTLPAIAATFIRAFIEQAVAPMLIFQDVKQTLNTRQFFPDEKESAVYRDVAALSFSDIKAGDSVKLRFLFRGDQINPIMPLDGAEQLSVLKGEKPDSSSRYSKKIREQILELEWFSNVERSKLFFQASGYGHFGGLGAIESVSIVKNN